MVREKFKYDRAAAAVYAEKWWNSHNPAFRVFPVDCSNYVSQCLLAGGFPMVGGNRRDQGWWYRGSGGAKDLWSFSWAVAHSLRWFLAGSPLACAVSSAGELQLGDVISYDFTGDGRWEHSTVVTAISRSGEPLVNAHTANSRARHWAYRDSPAFTPEIRYSFWHIIDRGGLSDGGITG